MVAPEDVPQKNSYKLFETCSGATVDYEGSKEFEAQLVVRVKSGNPPDIAYIPQPGLLKTLVQTTGKVVEAPKSVSDNVDKWFGKDWKAYGTVDGKFYAPPLDANVKSFVWYSPEDVRGQGLDHPDHLGRDAGAVRHDRGHRHQALVRGHRLRRGNRLAGHRLARGRHAP